MRETNGGETDDSLPIIRHTTECASVSIFHHRFERGANRDQNKQLWSYATAPWNQLINIQIHNAA